MRTNENQLHESMFGLYKLLSAMAVILFGMVIIGLGAEIYLKVKNDGQQTNKIRIETNK